MKKREFVSQIIVLKNPLGLHARPAGKLVQLAAQFKATVFVEKDSQRASADSVMELMMLMANSGDHLTITAMGPEASSALEAVVDLAQGGFGEV